MQGDKAHCKQTKKQTGQGEQRPGTRRVSRGTLLKQTNGTRGAEAGDSEGFRRHTVNNKKTGQGEQRPGTRRGCSGGLAAGLLRRPRCATVKCDAGQRRRGRDAEGLLRRPHCATVLYDAGIRRRGRGAEGLLRRPHCATVQYGAGIRRRGRGVEGLLRRPRCATVRNVVFEGRGCEIAWDQKASNSTQ